MPPQARSPGRGPGKPRFRPTRQGALFQEIISPDKWYAPFTDPVRLPPRLSPGTQPAQDFFVAYGFPGSNSAGLTFGPGAPQIFPYRLQYQSAARPPTEVVTLDKWFEPLAEPVRPKPRTPDFFALNASVFVNFGWLSALSEPTRAKPRTPDFFAPPLQPIDVYWFQAWTDPVRRKPQTPEFFAWAQVVVTPETVTVDKWFEGLSDPTRRKWPAPDWNAFDPSVFVNFGWPTALTEPVRAKARTPDFYALIARADPGFDWFGPLSGPTRLRPLSPDFWAFVPVVTIAPPETITVDKWFKELSQPVRTLLRAPWFQTDVMTWQLYIYAFLVTADNPDTANFDPDVGTAIHGSHTSIVEIRPRSSAISLRQRPPGAN